MSITKPPSLPEIPSLSLELRLYLESVDRYLNDIYTNYRLIQTGQVGITTSEADPVVGTGQDGDLHVRVDGANTALFININGVWSAYNNP